MAGHMGNARVTVRNLLVLESDPARAVLLIEGAVPGAKNGLLRIRRSKKAPESIPGIGLVAAEEKASPADQEAVEEEVALADQETPVEEEVASADQEAPVEEEAAPAEG